MVYVYILRSLSDPEEIYIGCTNNLKDRLMRHNAGEVPHTSKYIPWETEICIIFKDQDRARAFEKYLKTGSGWAFMKKRLL